MENQIVSREDWLTARRALLAEEKALTRAQDALAAKRRALPMVRIDKPYRFATEAGEKTLLELFDGRRQLLIYHFMFGADWSEGCPSCSFWADNFDHIAPHLAARDTTFLAISKAPLATLLAYRKRMGWSFPWASAGASGFNEDFHVTFDGPGGEHNFAPRTGDYSEMPGISAFLRDGDRVLHSYSTYGRGVEAVNGAYHFLDLTALGRNEAELPWAMAWIKRRDRYEQKGDAA